MSRLAPVPGVTTESKFIPYDPEVKKHRAKQERNFVNNQGFGTFDLEHFGTLKRSRSTVDQGSPSLLPRPRSPTSEDISADLISVARSKSSPPENTQDQLPTLEFPFNLSYSPVGSGKEAHFLPPSSPQPTFPQCNSFSIISPRPQPLHLQISCIDGLMHDQGNSSSLLSVPSTPLYTASSSASGSSLLHLSPVSQLSPAAPTSTWSPFPSSANSLHSYGLPFAWNPEVYHPDRNAHPRGASGHCLASRELPGLRSEFLSCGCMLIIDPSLVYAVGVIRSSQCSRTELPSGREAVDAWTTEEPASNQVDGFRVPISGPQKLSISQSMSLVSRAEDGSKTSASHLLS